MNRRIGYWVALIATIWMSATVTMSKGVRSMHNQLSLEVGHGQGKLEGGKKWALLVAGSNGYENYRHQANVCHAYQILKSGGVEDENIIVFMYDDIAYNEENPRPGVIINKPDGPNVYLGVPKDYTGNDTNARNFFAVLTGNKSALTGGSGKVLQSGLNDTIFIYYSSHGAAGFITMPDGSVVWGKDLVDALKRKHDDESYKKMVIYMEACHSGSMFEGLLPENMKIYVTTSANATEPSYAFYCPNGTLPPPNGYTTCLGDRYSCSWMEDSDQNDRTKETLKQQYYTVRNRTASFPGSASHVTQYGDINMSNDFLVTYLGAIPADVNDNYNLTSTSSVHSSEPFSTPTRDAYLLHLRLKLENAPVGSKKKLKAQKELDEELAHRERVDHNVHFIGDLLFGEEKSFTMMFHVRPVGQPLVDDWDCLKMLIKTYESHCDILSTYGRKYSRAFANMCNAGISEEQMIAATSQACPKKIHSSSISSPRM